jgi:restriction endonuclease Mrr
MNTWLHRISHHGDVSWRLLSRGYLSTGWSGFGKNADFLNAIEVGQWHAFDSYFTNSRPRSRHSLWHFVAEMRTGDRVIVPGSRSFFVYELIGNRVQPIGEVETEGLTNGHGKAVEQRPDGLLGIVGREAIDLGFVWQVRSVVQDVSRSHYADAALTSRMKYRGTTANISDLNANVDAALEAHSNHRPINLHATLLESSVAAAVSAINTALDPAKLEKLILWYLRKAGATHVDPPAKNERGKEGDADIVATFEPIRTIIYVQAKKYSGQTSDWATKQIIAYRDQKESSGVYDGYSHIAWVVSSGEDFSEECEALAEKHGVLLLNGKDFATLLVEAGIGGLDKAFI